VALLRLGWLLGLALIATPAAASGYDEFSRGLAAINRGDNDSAIMFFSSALQEDNLPAGVQPLVYYNRARAYLNKEECAQAVADLNAALQLQPGYYEAYLQRGRANRCAGNYGEAIADYSEIIEHKPTGDAYWQRALARWNEGDFDGSAQDSWSTALFAPNWPYPILWYGLAKLRAGKLDERDLQQKAVFFDLSVWPGTVFALYEGNATPDEIMRLARYGDPRTSRDRMCEADFYVGEWWLAKKNTEAARPLIESASSLCRHDFIEYSAANVELKRLGTVSVGARMP
jgi:lipoprotein NlpI